MLSVSAWEEKIPIVLLSACHCIYKIDLESNILTREIGEMLTVLMNWSRGWIGVLLKRINFMPGI